MNPTIQIEAERDVEGYLIYPENWNRDLAQALAEEEQIDLDGTAWPIIEFMREYWQEHQVAPDVRYVVEFLVNEHGMEKRAAKQQLFQLFPYGYVKQACKIAGMMRPRAWSTG